MNWREEKLAVVEALKVLLPMLDHPHLAVPLGFRLATITGLDEKRCRTVLGWLANDGHPNATHDGGEVRSYGRIVQRWRWHPTPQHAVKTREAYKPAEPLEHADLSLEEAGRLADCKTCGGTFLAVDIVNGKCTDCEDWSVAKED